MLSKILLTVLVVGICIWWFLKENTRRGFLTIRAYLFLTALENGKTVDEANHAASIRREDATPTMFANTMSYLDTHHRGKQMPMIRDARAKGMKY